MPTAKPRVSVTLEPDLFRTIHRFADLQGQSMSRVIGEILDAIHPPLSRTVTLLEVAKQGPDQVRQSLLDVIEDLELDIMEEHSSAQIAHLLTRARARFDHLDPRPSNTGVTPPKVGKNG